MPAQSEYSREHMSGKRMWAKPSLNSVGNISISTIKGTFLNSSTLAFVGAFKTELDAILTTTSKSGSNLLLSYLGNVLSINALRIL